MVRAGKFPLGKNLGFAREIGGNAFQAARRRQAQMRRVVMKAVGVADGSAAMIGLVELQHDAFHCGVQNLIGIDACAGQRIVLLSFHARRGMGRARAHHVEWLL